MKIEPWQIYGLPSVSISCAEFTQHVRKMKKWRITYETKTDALNTRSGQMVFGTAFEGNPIGLAWEWGEVVENVPALADPMTIVSNVVLLDTDDSVIDESERLVILNCAVHSLAWQAMITKRNQLIWEETLMAA